MKGSNHHKVGEQLILIAKKRKEMSGSERVQLLQRKLYLKAKQEKEFGFYVLYDKIFLGYVLEESWKRVKANGGSAGVDGMTFERVEQQGVEGYLKAIGEELRQQTYRPGAVKREWLPEANADLRPHGNPTIRDMVAQMACVIVIAAIFEADFEEHSCGSRPKRSAEDGIRMTKEHLKAGKTEV